MSLAYVGMFDLLQCRCHWRVHTDPSKKNVQVCSKTQEYQSRIVPVQVTVDMDVLGRLELLRFFKQECEERQCIIVYATHIFDGLADWMTHLALVANGSLVKAGPVADFPELQGDRKVLPVATKWLRAERERARAQPKQQVPKQSKTDLFGSRQMAYYR